MKKEGSILLEVAASLVILSLTISFIVSAYIQNNKILKERILTDQLNRDLSNLINEIKYNVSNEEIEDIFKNNNLKLKYDENFSKKLLTERIDELEGGDDIFIIKLDEDEKRIRFKVKAKVNIENSEVIREEEFFKSWWMDEV